MRLISKKITISSLLKRKNGNHLPINRSQSEKSALYCFLTTKDATLTLPDTTRNSR